MSTNNNVRPVILLSSRDEKAVKKVRDSLTSWANTYRSGEILSPKKQEKETTKPGAKNADKASYTAGYVKRTNIREKLNDSAQTLQILESKTNDPASMQIVAAQRDPLFRTVYMTEINCVGSIVDIATYISQRLSKTTTYYDIDSTLFALIAFLQGASKDPEAYVDLSNVNVSGNMKILRGFKMYADATSDDSEYDAITTLYNDFVVGIVDRGASLFSKRIIEHGGLNIVGQYNSSNNVRSSIFNKLRNDLDSASSIIYPLSNESVVAWSGVMPVAAGPGAVDSAKALDYEANKELGTEFNADYYLIAKALQRGAQIYVETALNSVRQPTIHVVRAEWLADKGSPKRKSDENQMNLIDIPAYAQYLGIVEEIVTLVPPKFRPEIKIPQLGPNGTTITKTQTTYPLLGLNPLNAGQLIYAHGITFSAAPLDYAPGRMVDANGKAKRLLTGHQALDAIIKRVKGFFTPDKNGSSNIMALLKREKYVSIHEADFTQNHGYHLNPYANSSTALLFPDASPPQILSPNGQLIMTDEQFASHPDMVLDLLLYSIGFPVGKVAINYESISNSVKGLYNVFSETLNYEGGVPSVIQFNTIPVDRASGNNFLSTNYSGVQAIRYAATRGSVKIRPGQGFAPISNMSTVPSALMTQTNTAVPPAPMANHPGHQHGQSAPLAHMTQHQTHSLAGGMI